MDNLTILDSQAKLSSILDKYKDKTVALAISGGADSDILIDLVSRTSYKVRYVFFDTGLEYQATKDHLKNLEQKYGITIDIHRAKTPIPISIRREGMPFISKYISDMISRLQRHNFDFSTADKYTLEEQFKRHPKCKGALKWFYNGNGEKSSFNISKNKLLREFLIEHPPKQQISDKCCLNAKKKPSKEYCKEYNVDIMLTGVRRAEGGIRASAYNRCVYLYETEADMYMPLFWYSDKDREHYENYYKITHSKCYTEYGLLRTGCAGCPFSSKFNDELEILKKHEPPLYKGVSKIFKEAYEYREKYINYKTVDKTPKI